jgi:hypothetical protein
MTGVDPSLCSLLVIKVLGGIPLYFVNMKMFV